MEVSSWENHLFLWAIYTMATLNNQRLCRFSPIALLAIATSTHNVNYEAIGSWHLRSEIRTEAYPIDSMVY